MSVLARFCTHFAISVTGSDARYSNNPPKGLERVKIKKSFSKVDLQNTELVVYTSAIAGSHEELVIAKRLGIECVGRDVFLAKLLEEFKLSICVAGTHGKTTTTSMLGQILKCANLSPALHVGGEYGDFFPFDKNIIVSEACEYKRSFLSLTPDICIILNTEYDHPDCYASQSEVMDAFLHFSRKTKAKGVVISPYPMSSGVENLVVGRDIIAVDIVDTGGYYSFTPIIKGVACEQIRLSVKGRHNVTNALFAILCAYYLKVDYTHIKLGLQSFRGVKLRYTERYLDIGKVIIDYAHHPSEIQATVDTVKCENLPTRVFFQPHTYSRTKAFFNEFVTALTPCNPLYIVEEYPARETPDMGASAYSLYQALKEQTDVCYLTLNQAREEIKKPYPLTLIMGAGNVSDILD